MQANYFVKNAFEKFIEHVQRFMLWREGPFLPPHKKNKYVEQFIEQELTRYYEEGIFELPSVQFGITTRCTLRCRDCSVMIPRFGENGVPHYEMSFAQFRHNFDVLAEAVDGIGTVLLLGGEPLLNKYLPDMVEYAASSDKVRMVNIVTNCTLPPSSRLLDVAAAAKHKVFFGLSNYAGNPVLAPVLKRAEIIEMLSGRDIKHTLDTGDTSWFIYELRQCEYSPAQMKEVFSSCPWHHCFYVLDSSLTLCARCLIGEKLGAFSLAPEDKIDLSSTTGQALRKHLLDFFEKDVFSPCQFCLRHKEMARPAEQLSTDRYKARSSDAAAEECNGTKHY